MEENPTSLLESLDAVWLKLGCQVMRESGPASQTLGGLLAVTNRQTFAPAETIADHAWLPLATVRKHLRSLHSAGWIDHRGREKTRAGWLRRTATIRVTAKTLQAFAPDTNGLAYGVLPWWACWRIVRVGKLSWGTRAVLSLVMARLMAIRKAVEERAGETLDGEDFMEVVDDLGLVDRFTFTLARIERDTGLARHTIIRAKGALHRIGFIKWWAGNEGNHPRDRLMPRLDIGILPTSQGAVRVVLLE